MAAEYSRSQEEAMEKATMELAEDLQSQFRDRDQLYRDIDAVLFGNLDVQIPEAYRKTAIEVRSPMALDIATSVTAALSTNPMSVNFKPIGFGDVYQQNSTLREKFFEASWLRQEQEARRPLLRLFLWSLVVKGEGILKTVERCHTAWADYAQQAADVEKLLEAGEYDADAKDRLYDHQTEELKLQLPYPIATTDVPPETFYYTRNENGLTSCVEIKEVPYQTALERFGAGLDSSGNVVDPQTWSGLDPRAAELARAEWGRLMKGAGGKTGSQNTIRCIEAWDWQCQVILLQGPNQRNKRGRLGEGTLCKVVRHAYGDPVLKVLRGPYFHALGITTGSRLPEHAGLSVLYQYLSLFPLVDSLLTMQANAAYMTGFPAFKKNTPPGVIQGLGTAPYGQDGREGRKAEQIEPGKLYPFDVSPIDQPKSGVDSDKLYGNVKQMLESALPSSVQGMVSGDTSGYALNQAAYLARLQWDPIVKNAEVALGERVGFESWCIENRISERVYAWGEIEATKGKKTISGQSKAAWLGIGPEDLKGVHRYEATLAPSTPSNEIVATRAIGEKMQLKLITYEDAVEQSGSNPDEVEKSWLLHELKNSPEVQAELKNAVFQKVATIRATRLGAAGMPSAAEMAGVGATGVMGGTPGAPPMPGPGGMPPNPVPSPGAGLPLAPPPPAGMAGGGMPPGGIVGNPNVQGPPANMLPMPGA